MTTACSELRPDLAEQTAELLPERKGRVDHDQEPAAVREIVRKPGCFFRQISVTRTDFGHHVAVRRNCRHRRQHDRPHGVAKRRHRQLQPVETVRLALQKVSGSRYLVAPQRLHMREMEVRRTLGDALAVPGHEADDIDLLLQDPQGRVGHLGEIDGVLDDNSPAFGLQQSGVIGANPELARLRRLLVEVDRMELEMPVLARRDGQQVLGVDRVPVRMVVEIDQRDVGPESVQDRFELRRRGVGGLAADVQINVVAEDRDIRQRHHHDGADRKHRVEH